MSETKNQKTNFNLNTQPQKIGDEGKVLFLGDISRNVSEKDLLDLFNSLQLQGILTVDIKKDYLSRLNLGYGFVTFRSVKDAKTALQKLEGKVIDDRQIRVGWGNKTTSLFVSLLGDIRNQFTIKILIKIFREYGPIYENEVFIDRNKYGYIRFHHRTHAEKAKESLNDKLLSIKFNGKSYKTFKPVRIEWGDKEMKKNSVHCKFNNFKIKEHNLIGAFQPFGEITCVCMKNGYAFIHYKNELSAAKAVIEMHNKVVSFRNGTEMAKLECNWNKSRKIKESNKKKNNNYCFKKINSKVFDNIPSRESERSERDSIQFPIYDEIYYEIFNDINGIGNLYLNNLNNYNQPISQYQNQRMERELSEYCASLISSSSDSINLSPVSSSFSSNTSSFPQNFDININPLFN